MKMERAVYGEDRKIKGYMMFYQDVKDKTNTEIFVGFKKVVVEK